MRWVFASRMKAQPQWRRFGLIAIATASLGCNTSSTQNTELVTSRDRYLAADTLAGHESARTVFIQDLRRRYGPPGEKAEHVDPFKGGVYAKRALALFRDWNPVCCKAEDVRLLLGPPHEETASMYSSTYSYRFVHGMAGSGWKFEFDADGTVLVVRFLPGE